MDEGEIRRIVESRKIRVNASVSWYTPGGNGRSSPLYEGEITNDYLNKRKIIKARSMDEFRAKANETVETWTEQEIRKRIVDAKRDANDQAQAEEEAG